MPCNHKFQQFLNLERLDFDPTVLIVGTFNPAWPNNNNAEWFYGRVRNNYLWDVLPRLFHYDLNLRTSTSLEWKEFCSVNRVALTDLLYSIDDADVENSEHQEILSTYLDTSIADYFSTFTFTKINSLLEKHPSIKNIYLTRQKGVPLFDNQWKLVEDYATHNSLHVKNLLTPSASARFHIHEYKQANPTDRTPLRNFIYESWKKEWHINPTPA
jgi:hypothetical protein